MKKIFKRLFSFVMAASMLLACTVVASASSEVEPPADKPQVVAYSNTLQLSGNASAFGASGHITIPSNYSGLYVDANLYGFMNVTFWCPALGVEQHYYNIRTNAPGIPTKLNPNLPAGDYDVLVSFSEFSIGHSYNLKFFTR